MNKYEIHINYGFGDNVLVDKLVTIEADYFIVDNGCLTLYRMVSADKAKAVASWLAHVWTGIQQIEQTLPELNEKIKKQRRGKR